MSGVDSLLKAFERFVALPWKREVAGYEKVWFCIYEPRDERRLLAQMDNFEIATKAAKKSWLRVDLTNSFGEWLSQHDNREGYFASPELLDGSYEEFAEALADTLRNVLGSADEKTLVALTGAGSLFGLASVSKLVDAVALEIAGRLAVFFPGHKNENNYRLLDARDGWNYIAVPIEGEVPQP